MLLVATIVIITSVLIQFTAAGRALYLIKVTGRKTAWTFLSLGLIGMGIRRSFTVYYIMIGNITRAPELSYEIIGLITSFCMLFGIFKVAPVFLDIKRSEEALRESESKLRDVMDSIPDPVFILKRDGTIIDYHGDKNVYLPVPSSVFLHKKIHESVGEDIGNKSMLCIEEAFRTNRTQRTEFQYHDVDRVIEYEGRYTVIGPDQVLAVCRDISERKHAEAEKEKLIEKLQTALNEIKTLKGLLPICSACKRVRHGEDSWEPIESYIKKHSQADFSHGLCPECAKILYPEIYFKKHDGKE